MIMDSLFEQYDDTYETVKKVNRRHWSTKDLNIEMQDVEDQCHRLIDEWLK